MSTVKHQYFEYRLSVAREAAFWDVPVDARDAATDKAFEAASKLGVTPEDDQSIVTLFEILAARFPVTADVLLDALAKSED